MNKIILIGNLTRDPEISATQSGVSLARMSIAVSRQYTNADGERETDFFNITAWRGLADNCGKYLKKGNKVCVVGSLQTRSYEDNEGNRRMATEIVAQDIEFLTPKNRVGSGDVYNPQASGLAPSGLTPVDDDDDLPF